MKSSKGSTTGALWGELPARETHKQEVITPDIIDNVWRQVMDETNNTDCDYHLDKQPEYIQLPVGNLHVLNTINLHRRLRAMESGASLSSFVGFETCNAEEDTARAHPFNFLSPRTDKIVFKESTKVKRLQAQTAHTLLRHAVVVLLAHIGYETASDVAIETLTDAADHFLQRLTLLLKVASEQENHGFPDAVERVLLEAGVGGAYALHDYYQEYVLKYEENMKRKVEKVAEKRRQMELSASSSNMELDDSASKLKFEELDEFGNIYREVPTLQLLDPEMGFPPSLDAGFQMLHSLEQDELNSLEVEEDEVNVSDSPSTGQLQRSDVSYDKIKKL